MTDTTKEAVFLIEKRGLYYRPDAAGYTGLKREAGRYSFGEAAERVGPNGPDGPQDGMSMWSEDEAPEYSSSCSWDWKIKDQAYQAGFSDGRSAAELATARRDALEEAAILIENFTQAQHVAQDMKSGVFPDQSPKREAMAAAIRSLQDKIIAGPTNDG